MQSKRSYKKDINASIQLAIKVYYAINKIIVNNKQFPTNIITWKPNLGN